MKKSTLRRLYEDACNEMAKAERERDALLADADEQVISNANEVQRVHNLHSDLLHKYDALTLALSFLLGDDRKNRLVELAEAGAWAFNGERLSRKSIRDLDSILDLFDEPAEDFPLDSPEPPESVRAVRGFNGVTFLRTSWGWRAVPPGGDGGYYSWHSINGADCPRSMVLADVTSEVA